MLSGSRGAQGCNDPYPYNYLMRCQNSLILAVTN